MGNQAEMIEDAKVARAHAESKFWGLYDQADKLADENTRRTVTSLIYSAIVNANDTVDMEGAATDAEWLSLAKGTLSSELACGGDKVTKPVVRWFADAGFKA